MARATLSGETALGFSFDAATGWDWDTLFFNSPALERVLAEGSDWPAIVEWANTSKLRIKSGLRRIEEYAFSIEIRVTN